MSWCQVPNNLKHVIASLHQSHRYTSWPTVQTINPLKTPITYPIYILKSHPNKNKYKHILITNKWKTFKSINNMKNSDLGINIKIKIWSYLATHLVKDPQTDTLLPPLRHTNDQGIKTGTEIPLLSWPPSGTEPNISTKI